MEQPIIVRYRYTQDEFVAAQKMNQQRNRKRSIIKGLTALVILAGSIAYFLITSELKFTEILSMIIGSCMFLAMIYLITLLLYRKIWSDSFNQYPAKNMEVEYYFTPDGIQNSDPLARSEIHWEGITEIIQGNKGFMLFTHPQIMHWIPIHGFENEDAVSAFVTLAKDKIKKFHQL